ncbi:13381_t:CDS:1, partial [Racocetra fulgida]
MALKKFDHNTGLISVAKYGPDRAYNMGRVGPIIQWAGPGWANNSLGQ